jgi:tetratricopeptide (TPR) repeat protein
MPTAKLQQAAHQQATDFYNRGEWSVAAGILSAAIAENESAELWSDWGAVQAARGEPADAERAFRRALRMDPAWRPAAENLGVLLYAQGRLSQAQQYLQQALDMDANLPPASQAGGNPDARSSLEAMLAQCIALNKNIRAGQLTPSAKSPDSTTVTAAAKKADTSTRPATEQNSLPTSVADARQVSAATTGIQTTADYDAFCLATFGQRIPVPGVRIAASWAEDSNWGLRAYNALAQLECEYAQELLRELAAGDVPGDIVEFGIYQGWWINFLFQASEAVGLRRRIYGFDSFEGLSDPHPEHDQAFWKKGQYACSLEQVSKNVRLAERPRLKLVKGFFEKSLRTAEALLAEQFCYARIDCDIYKPALECLHYLGPRLADGAIVVFDDWPHLRGFGEQRALEEWLPTVPGLKFEFLFYGAIGHFYTRVHHR